MRLFFLNIYAGLRCFHQQLSKGIWQLTKICVDLFNIPTRSDICFVYVWNCLEYALQFNHFRSGNKEGLHFLKRFF